LCSLISGIKESISIGWNQKNKMNEQEKEIEMKIKKKLWEINKST
jgi:hypothetical protein